MDIFRRQMVALACAAALLTPCVGLAEGPIKIGFPMPLSGPTAVYGVPILKGAEMAVDEINAKGGVLGRKLELLSRDSKANADEAVRLARELIIKNNADFLSGTLTSAEAPAVSTIAKENKIVCVAPTAKTMLLTAPENLHPYIFRFASNTMIEGRTGASIMAKWRDVKRVATIAPDYAYGRDAVAAYVEPRRASMTSLLALEDIHTAYGLSRVLFGISLAIEPGECVCLLGRNGVGKTTTMRSVMGLTPPTNGRVLWQGRDVTGWAPHRVARAGIGFVPEDRRIFAELSVRENLEVGARAARRPGRWTIATVGELFPVLQERRDQRGGFLSGGEQQMLTIARTLMGNPDLLLLDEPSEGLAPLVVETLRLKIGELKAQGLTILLAEQGVDFALSLADRVYVLEKGTIRHSGAAAELRDDKSMLDKLLSL